MTKKIIILFLSILIIFINSSCSKFGTYEEEMQKKLDGNVEKVNNLFTYEEFFTLGKYTGSGEIATSASVDGIGEFSIGTSYDGNIEIESKDFAYDGDAKFSFMYKFADKLSNDFKNQLRSSIDDNFDLTGVKMEINLDTKLGIADKNAYFSLDNFDFEVTNPNNIPELEFFNLINIDYINNKLGSKWLKYDFSKEFDDNLYEEFLKLLSELKDKYLAKVSDYKNLFGYAVSGDIFVSDGQLTEYEGKKAYKFTVDEEKFKEHLISTSELFLKTNKDIIGLDDDEIAETIDKMRGMNLFEYSEMISEGYLVKNGKNVDLILNLSLEYDNENKITLEILPEKTKIEFVDKDEGVAVIEILPNYIKIKLNEENSDLYILIEINYIKEVDGNIKYDGKMICKGDLDNNGKDDDYSLYFSGNYKFKKDGNNLDFEFSNDSTITLSEFKELYGKGNDSMNFKFKISSKLKKDDKIEISEKSILGDNEAMTAEEYMNYINEITNYFDYIDKAKAVSSQSGIVDEDGFLIDQL